MYSSATVKVNVDRGDIFPIISNGLHFSLEVGDENYILVDASNSYDEDVDINSLNGVGNQLSDTNLLFEWSCYQHYPELVDNCNELLISPSIIDNNNDNDNDDKEWQHSKMLNISAPSSLEGHNYKLNLRYWSSLQP